jgi:hypothetical protein
MDQFPAGGFDVDGMDKFNDWVKELRALESSKSLGLAVRFLLSFSGRMDRVAYPVEVEDGDESDEVEVSEAAAPASATEGPVRVTRQSTSVVSAPVKPKQKLVVGPKDFFVENVPRVSLPDVLPHPDFAKLLS